jgi:hypothetical protein
MMSLDDWIAALGDRVSPAGKTSRRTVEYLLPRLDDLPPAWFTEAAIEGIFRDLRSLNSAERVRSVLREFHARQQRQQAVPEQVREREAWDERQAWLCQDWDDAAGIMRKVHAYSGDLRALRLLAFLVRRWAPQHLGYLPPHILEAIERDDAPPAVTVADRTPRYASPELLDRINPLPGGVKRHAPEAAAASNDQDRAVDPVTT